MDLAIRSYPKVYNIGHAAIRDLFLDDVLIEEKVDGSQFSFEKRDGEVLFRSHGAQINSNEPEKMFLAGVRAIKEIAENLQEGFTYSGEYLSKLKHNVLSYARVPEKNVILFDIRSGEELYLNREAKEYEAARIGLELVPLIYKGRVEDPESLLALLNRESVLGQARIEGIVVKNYLRFGLDGKALMGKFVSEAFREIHGKEWKAANPSIGDVVERLILSLRTEARWAKAVIHLREEGKLQNVPQDIGLLIREVQDDIRKEEREYIKDKLLEWSLPKILRASTGGLPEWYKERLLRSAFEKEVE